MIDATPDVKFQLWSLHNRFPFVSEKLLNGIFLTHGHIGHYAGLLNLDKAIMNSKNIPVYAMPKMSQFLRDNCPWNELLENLNIDLHNMSDNVVCTLNNIQDGDIVLVDGTFFGGTELPNRDMSKIPHPTIESSLQRFTN